MLTYHLITEDEKRAVASWQYEGEYAAYNMLPYEEQQKRGNGLANLTRQKNYYSYLEKDTLIGFTNILEQEEGVFVGIGVAPSYCGQGYGKEIMRAAIARAKELYPGKEIFLEVKTWNKRAISCYEKVGFAIVGEAFTLTTGHRTGEFYRMVLQE